MLTDKEKKIQELALLERQQQLKRGLPFLYGWKHYIWSRAFFDSTNKECFLVAANQVGKSSTNIRKCIHWATAQDLWPKLWNVEAFGNPNQFWYFYPTREVATIEFKTKWSLFLPRDEFKNHPIYGWKEEFDAKQINAIHFNSGVSVYFKTYKQDIKDLQTGTVYALFGDEEMPVEYLPELQARLNATDGYFHLVFTATLGQEHWRRCMEEQGGSLETHKGALKINASLYDCMKFEDGTLSHWSEEKIARAIAKCPTQAEVKRRIFGRFVVADGLKYGAFDPERNSSVAHPLPASWYVYAGVDVGSGGQSGHPAAIVFVGVSPDYKQGRVFRAWRGDGIVTTPTDVLLKFREMRGKMKMQAQFYDWASKDFYNIAASMGESFQPAEKNHEIGEGVMNTLFRHKMISIQRGESDLEKLVAELSTILVTTPKNKAADDLADALRYTVTGIPWDYAAVDENIDLEKALQDDLREKPVEKILTPYEQVDKERKEAHTAWKKQEETLDVSDELDEWQELYGN